MTPVKSFFFFLNKTDSTLADSSFKSLMRVKKKFRDRSVDWEDSVLREGEHNVTLGTVFTHLQTTEKFGW